MNTFILAKRIDYSALFLDKSRLHKQAVEIKQILTALNGGYRTGVWSKHPAVLQWTNHRKELAMYGFRCVEWWIMAHGHKSSLGKFFHDQLGGATYDTFPEVFWPLISYHQGQMLSKNYDFYLFFFSSATPTTYATYVDPEKDYRLFQIRDRKRVYLT